MEVRAPKNTICNTNVETIKMLAFWIKIIQIEMVDSTYPEIKKKKIKKINMWLPLIYWTATQVLFYILNSI